MATAPPGSITFAIRGPIERDDLPGMCDGVRGLLAGFEPSIAFCDVHGAGANAVTVEALARLQLAARRRGCQVRLLHASPALLELVDFMGLADVLAE